MEKWYYIILDLSSFALPFLFSFEKRWMHFIRFWKPYFLSIIFVGLFFLVWDVYFAYSKVWWFNDQYLIGVHFLKLPLEEWLFFLLIPYSSNFIHYTLEYFFPKLILSDRAAQLLTVILFFVGLTITVMNFSRSYTFVNFGVFTILMLLQSIFRWPFIKRFFLSYILIYIPFYFVNSALTGSYTENPVVYYDNHENLGIRIGTMPIEDSFYCFSMLYGSVLIFEWLRRKWNYSLEINNKIVS